MVAAQASAAFLLSLFFAHAEFDRLEVFAAFARLPLLELDASTFWTIRIVRRRDLHIAADDMMTAEIVIDIRGRDLACRDGADDCGWSRDAVAAGEDACHVLYA